MLCLDQLDIHVLNYWDTRLMWFYILKYCIINWGAGNNAEWKWSLRFRNKPDIEIKPIGNKADWKESR